jgi:hypothetical protein
VGSRNEKKRQRQLDSLFFSTRASLIGLSISRVFYTETSTTEDFASKFHQNHFTGKSVENHQLESKSRRNKNIMKFALSLLLIKNAFFQDILIDISAMGLCFWQICFFFFFE